MRIFRHFAEVCPNCGAVGSFRANIPARKKGDKPIFQGRSLTVDTERRTYVACTKCGAHALRITQLPR